jgi:hypothetical protein
MSIELDRIRLLARNDVADVEILDGRLDVVDDVGEMLIGTYDEIITWLNRGAEPTPFPKVTCSCCVYVGSR